MNSLKIKDFYCDNNHRKKFSCEKKNTKKAITTLHHCTCACLNCSSQNRPQGGISASTSPNSGSLLRRELLRFGQHEHFTVAAEQMLSPDERRFNQIKLIFLPDLHPSPVREFHTHTHTHPPSLSSSVSTLCH